MIAASSSPSQFESQRHVRWQQVLADAVSSPAELCDILGIELTQIPAASLAATDFPLRVPRGYLARMRRGDPRDPLLLQVLPQAAELLEAPGYSTDPVGDMDSRAAPGLLQKYAGRALLVATGACAVHCRYCFRRHFPYHEESAAGQSWQPALEQIRADSSVSEVILSGGDPLSLSGRRLHQLTEELISIRHVRRLRIHTRYPIVLPERIDAELLQWLTDLPIQKVVVVHANHAQEMDNTVRRACHDLAAAGATLLNQSVLLAGVNDSVSSLVDLSEALFDMGVLPYYLHVLDRVQGAAHFEVVEATALDLHAELAARLPGYLVPRLVRELPGGLSKTPVMRQIGPQGGPESDVTIV